MSPDSHFSDEVETLSRRLQTATRWSDQVKVMREVEQCAQTNTRALTSVVPILLERLKVADEWVQQAAARALGAIADPQAVGPLCALLAFEEHTLPDELGPNRNHTILAHAMVSSDEDDVRHSAAQALGQIGDPRALPALQACAAHEGERARIRKAARAAMVLIESKES